MTSQDEITHTAERLKDALGAAADVMMADGSPVRARRSSAGRAGRAGRWLLPSSAAASIVAIALVAVLVSQLTSNTGGPSIMAGGLGPGGSASVQAPDPAVLQSPGYLAARSRVIKILGFAPNCAGGGRLIEGSGFVYAPQHVITNAHVVAGVTRPASPATGTGPTVTTPAGQTLPSTVVFYDPQVNIAVLYVPGLKLAPLRFNTQANPGDSAVVAGYPENHAFTGVAARIAQVQTAQGQDIYQSGLVTRQIYKIKALVREGNSGGPLLSPSGTVDGVVFAAVVGRTDTGFALTASEIQADATTGATATAPVATQGCT